MKKNAGKRAIIFIMWILIIGSFSTNVNASAAEEPAVNSGMCGDNVKWELKNGVLTISGNGPMHNDYNRYTLPWWDSRELITAAVVEDGVSNIGQCTFMECAALKHVTIPDNITSIGASAFNGCSSLEDIDIPDSVEDIGVRAFMGCAALKKVNIPSSLTCIEIGIFEECSGLESVIIPENVVLIKNVAFASCGELKITILNKDCEIGFIVGRESNTTIYGYIGSTAEAFAEERGVNFVPLDSEGSESDDSDEEDPDDPEDTGKIDNPENSDNNSKSKAYKIRICGISNKIAAGKKIKLTVQTSPSNVKSKAITWKSSNRRIAAVNKRGIVTIKKGSGGKSVTITATDSSGVKAVYKIRSMKGVVKKVCICGKKTVKAGKSLKLKAKVSATKNANKTLKWTSSNTKYAKVNKSGKVITYEAGKGKKVRITAMATDGSNKKKSITITIR